MIWFDVARLTGDLMVGIFLCALALALSRDADRTRGDTRQTEPVGIWLFAMLLWPAGAIAHCLLGGYQVLTVDAGQWNFYSVGWPLILTSESGAPLANFTNLPPGVWMSVLFLDLAIAISLLVAVRLALGCWWTSWSQRAYRRLAAHLTLAGGALLLVLQLDRWLATPRYLPTPYDLMAHAIAAHAPWYVWGPVIAAGACQVWVLGWLACKVLVRLAQARAEGAI